MNAKNQFKKYELSEILSDSPSYLMDRVRTTKPHSKSMTLHSARAIIELLESMQTQLRRIENKIDGFGD